MTKTTKTDAAPPAPSAGLLNIAEARRSDLRRRYLRDLDAVNRISAPVNPGCPPSEYARMAAQRQTAISDIQARIDALDALAGWDLVRYFKADEGGSYRG